MSNELEGYGQTGLPTTYAIIKRRGLVWDGSSFVAYATDDRNQYAVTLAELGDASGNYQGNFPTAITDSGTYSYAVYQSPDGIVEETNTYIGGGNVDWTGNASANAVSGSMSGSDFYDYVIRTFKRDDKSTEVYEAITDTVRDMRLRYEFDEATEDTTTTDTISTLGDFTLELESDMSMLLGVTLQDSTTATPLKLRTKQQFDSLYPDIHVTNDRGYPKHYCIFAGNIYVGPVPDSTAYTYRVSQSNRGGSVTSSTTAVPFTGIDRELIKHGTLSRLFVMLEKPDLATIHEELYRDRLGVNIDRERKNKGQGTFIVTPFGM